MHGMLYFLDFALNWLSYKCRKYKSRVASGHFESALFSVCATLHPRTSPIALCKQNASNFVSLRGRNLF